MNHRSWWIMVFVAFCFTPKVFAVELPETTRVRIKVETTLFPIFDMARAVGGERAEVSLLLPPGVEPHSFEPTPGDMVRISASDIFIYTGLFMEPWVERMLPGITNQNLQIIEAGHGLKLTGLVDQGPEAAGQGHDHGGVDPHVWLDFSYDMHIVDNIAEAYIDRDPENRMEYLDRASRYKAKLSELDLAYRDGLRNCRDRTIIYGGHFAFGYLAARYNLQHISPYAGFAPNAEPSPRAVGELIKNIRAHHSKTIFYEELIEPRVARVIAEETGASAVLLSAAHNVSADELNEGVSFIAIMQDDLLKLRKGLQCQ